MAWFELHDKLAGWAQFFGTVLAILATWWLANKQFKKEVDREFLRHKTDSEHRRAVTVAAVKQLGTATGNVLAYMETTIPPNVAKSYFDDARAGLASVAIVDIPDEGLATKVFEIRDLARLVRAEMEIGREPKVKQYLSELKVLCENLCNSERATHAAPT